MKNSLRSCATFGTWTVLFACAAFAGCGSDSSSGGTPSGGGAGSGGSSGAAGTAGSTGGGAGAGATGGSGGAAGAGATAGGGGESGSAGAAGSINPPQTRMTITGDATWNVTFDADAKAAGATDCSYTRHYVGVQDDSMPWLCPACEVIFHATVDMPVGLQDCFMQVSDIEPFTEEWVGYGGGKWYRSYGLPGSDQGAATVSTGAISITNVVEDLEATEIGAGTMAFQIDGSFVVGEEDGDPMHGWVAADSYACGWPKSDPPPYQGDYALVVGAPIPDGLFLDSCGEVVRLHDFKGTYLVFEMSALDCPACQSMAEGEVDFVADMAALGIEVHVITLMAPALDDPFGETTKQMLDYWINKFSLESPVLADRSWGLSMFLPITEDETGYPSWAVVDPDLNVLRIDTGTSWTSIRTAITADAQ